jgi:hypothetical protein
MAMRKICIDCKGVKVVEEMYTKRSMLCKECFNKALKIKANE